MVLNEEELNKKLKPILKKINDHNIKLNENESKTNVQIVDDTADALITAMKNVDPLFEKLFQRKVYTGSYYEGLRVKNATEFDLNIVLRLSHDYMEIIPLPNAPGFIELSIRIIEERARSKIYEEIDFFDDDGKLVRTIVRKWMQSITDKAMKWEHFTLPAEVESIGWSQNGPSFTYDIETIHGTIIGLDLVPVIDCEKFELPDSIHQSKRFKQLKPKAKILFLVPKPYVGPVPKNDSDTYWRYAFPEAEKKLLKIGGCVKMLIKLLKLLRDEQGWHKIYSYCIKTLFLLELDEYPSKYDWMEENLGTLFMEMLEKLYTAVKTSRLEYYFDRKANLLKDLRTPTSNVISKRLDAIIEDIKKDPRNLTKYFPKEKSTHVAIYMPLSAADETESSWFAYCNIL